MASRRLRGYRRPYIRTALREYRANACRYIRTVARMYGGNAMMAAGDHAHPVDAERVAHARDRVLAAEDAARLAGLLGLLADPVRSRILSALDHVEELCVGDLALALDVSEDAASYGLRLLRTGGMVQNRKVGRIVYYRLADEFPEPLLAHCLRQLITLTRAIGADDSIDPDAGTAAQEVQR
jgi:ArsR family transcriptional regulator, lead/cadmium/zinc/bismuth-responsive transcriptional repressor